MNNYNMNDLKPTKLAFAECESATGNPQDEMVGDCLNNKPIPYMCREIHEALDCCISMLCTVRGHICGTGNETKPEMLQVDCMRESLASMLEKARRAREIAFYIRSQFEIEEE